MASFSTSNLTPFSAPPVLFAIEDIHALFETENTPFLPDELPAPGMEFIQLSSPALKNECLYYRFQLHRLLTTATEANLAYNSTLKKPSSRTRKLALRTYHSLAAQAKISAFHMLCSYITASANYCGFVPDPHPVNNLENNFYDLSDLFEFFDEVILPFKKLVFLANLLNYSVASWQMNVFDQFHGTVPLDNQAIALAISQGTPLRYSIQLALCESGIEPNPGPARTPEEIVEDMKVQYWTQWKTFMCEFLIKLATLTVLSAFIQFLLITIEKNPGPVVIDGLTIKFMSQSDPDQKHSRAKLISRQRDEKKYRNELLYKRRFNELLPYQKGRLTGSCNLDFEYFHQLLVEYGYASDRLLLLPSAMIIRIFKLYEDGYGLQHYEKIHRLFIEKGIHDIPQDNRTPEPGAPARQLLMKFFFRSFSSKFPHLSAVLQGHDNQMFEGILSGFGAKIAEGFKKEIQPVWESIVNQISSLTTGVLDAIKSCSVFLGLFAFSILVGTIGVALIYKYRTVLFSMADGKENETNYENQALEICKGLVSKTFVSWCTYLGAIPDKFIAKFNDAHMEESIKRFGNLASAFNNIYILLGKLRDVAKYVIDKSWSFVFGVPYFKSTRDMQEVVSLVNKMLAIVRVKDIPNKGTDEKIEFCKAFEDLVEMAPFIGKFDHPTSTQINLAVTAATSTYSSVKETLRFTAARQKPVWCYLFGDPGAGKTVFTLALSRLIFETLKREHYEIWKEIGKEVFDQTLMYQRQSEQEYWDRYANQWVTVYDDLLQQKDPQATEAFSLIRAKTDAPYPLHMASIQRKETTTFQSKIIVSSTNAKEESLKGMSGLTDYRAFARRRDMAIKVSRVGEATADYTDIAACSNLLFEFHFVDPNTGNLSPPEQLQGMAGAMTIVRRMVKVYVANYKIHKRSTQSTVITDDEWNSLSSLNTAPSSSSSTTTAAITTAVSSKITVPPLPPKTWKHQCFHVPKFTVPYLDFASYFPRIVHPTFVQFAYQLDGIRIKTYDEAVKFVAMKRKQAEKFWQDYRFDNIFIRYGILAKNKWKSISPQRDWLSFLKLAHEIIIDDVPATDEQKAMCLMINQRFETDFVPQSFARYIGLSNPIYHHKKKKEIIEYLEEIGFVVYTYDQVRLFGIKSVEFASDKANAEILLKYKGDSVVATEIRNTKLALAALIGGAAVAIGIIHFIFSNMPHFETQSNAKYLEKLRKEAAKRPTHYLGSKLAHLNQSDVVEEKKKKQFEHQFTDEQSRQICPTIINNTYAIEVKTQEENYFNQFCSGIKECTFVTAAHLFQIPKIVEVRLYPVEYPGNSYTIAFEDIKKRVIPNRDLVLFTIPGMNFVRTVTHHLPKRSDSKPQPIEGLSRVDRWDTLTAKQKEVSPCVTYDKEGNIMKASPESSYVLIPAISPAEMTSQKNVGAFMINIVDCYKFRLIHNTASGDCGKTYLWFNPQVPQKILGYHVAGSDDEALASPLYQEDVEEYFIWLQTQTTPYQSQFRAMTLDQIHVHEDDSFCAVENLNGSFMGMPQVAKLSTKFNWPRKTRLVPTPVCKPTNVTIGMETVLMPPPFPVTHAPALLHTKGDLDPVPISLRQLKDKTNRYVTDFRVREYYDGIFGEATKYLRGKFLSKSEGIKGVLGWMHLHPTPRNTSMAFYHQKEGKKSHFVLTAQEHYDALPLSERGRFRQLSATVWLDYRIDDLIDRWFEAVKQGKIPPNVVLFCLKDEPRPLDRVAMGKTRAFFMGPFVLMVVTKMIFGDFFNLIETHHSYTDSAVGINPYSMQWKVMYDQLMQYGPDVIDDDVSGFDQNFPVIAFVDGFPEIYCKEVGFLPGSFEAACVFASLYSNLCTYVAIGDEVYLLLAMPSGVIITCFVNTIENSVENRAIMKLIVPTHHFNEIAKQKCFGDDIIQSIKKEWHSVVTRQRIRQIAFERFGHTRTDSTKSDALTGFSNIHSAWFLQRNFKPDGSLVLAPLNIDSINTMLQWIESPKDKSFEAQFKINCDQALMELARHSKEKFEAYKNVLNLYLTNYGNTYKYTHTYEEQYLDVISRATRT